MSRAQRLGALATAVLLAGCAGGSGAGAADGWVDRMVGSPAAQGKPRVAYVAAARAKVYSEPNAQAPVVGVLTRDEAVSRYQHEYGFAYVLAEGNVAGWVRENELAERRPAARKSTKPQPAPTPPSPPEAATPAEAPTIEVAPETSEAPAPENPIEEDPVLDEEALEPERSVFDPY